MSYTTQTTISKKTITAARKQEAYDGLVEQIHALVEKRVRWEQGTYAASNTELYSILGDCLDLFIAVKKSYDLPKGVNSLLDVFGIKYNSATSLELKLVRLVFASTENAERIGNRLFGYARVISLAADEKQTSATLAQFIADNHGIDEIRRIGKDGVNLAEKQKQLTEHARNQLIVSNTDELFTGLNLPDDLQPVAGEHFSLALVRKNEDGTGSIVFGTNNVAMVSKVLSIAGKKLHETSVQAAEQIVAQNDEAVRTANMAALEQTMSSDVTFSSAQQSFTPQNANAAVPA